MSAKGQPFRLDGKVAMVTGAGRGIGRGAALALGQAGADLVLLARTRTQLDDVAREVPTQTLALAADVTNLEGHDPIVRNALRRFGHIDILVNAAGTTLRAAAEDVTPDQLDAVLDVNLRGLFFLTQRVGREMLARGHGRIILICSLLSQIGRGHNVPYAASKGAVRQLVKQLAVEWSPRGVTVNGIGPGYIETDLVAGLRDDPDFNRWLMERLAVPRWGRPEDIGAAAVYLSSDEAAYVTGQILYVDGGFLAK